MNNKLHLSDLVAELATKTQKKEELAENFLRELFALIEEALVEEQLVKIKEIGTFKLQLVNARRIANVQTGETQEIPEYYKVVFTPDKRLASLVNEPYRHLSSVEIYENGEFKMIENNKEEIEESSESNADDDGAVETVLLDEIVVTPHNQHTEQPKQLQEPSHPPIVLSKMDVKTLAQLYLEEEEPTVEKQSEPEPESTPEVQFEPSVIQEEAQNKFPPLPQSEPQQPEVIEEPPTASADSLNTNIEKPKPSKSKKRSWAWIAATLLFLVAGGGGYYYITHHRVPSNQIFQVVIGEPTPEEIADSIRQAKIDSLKAEIKSEPAEPVYKPLDTIKYDAKRYLTQISRQYYGNKYFWVYIYEENKDKIADFNNVKHGTMLVIPASEKYGINAQDTASLSKAKEIGSRLVLEREAKMKK